MMCGSIVRSRPDWSGQELKRQAVDRPELECHETVQRNEKSRGTLSNNQKRLPVGILLAAFCAKNGRSGQ
jgi:hypothetical protein